MNKVALVSLLICINTQAHWFGLNCSTADQGLSFVESKMGTEVTYTKDDGDSVTITTNYSNNDMLVMNQVNDVLLNEVDERECLDGVQSYYISNTYATKATITFENSTGLFPAGYYVSKDGKSISAHMICEYMSGGASSCAE